MKSYWKILEEKEPIFFKKRHRMIREAAEEVALKDLEDLKKQEELYEPHTFSPEFEQRMELLFQKHEVQKKKKYSFLQAPRVALAGILCAFVIGSAFVGIKTEAIPFPKFNYIVQKDVGSYAYLIEQEEHVKRMVEETYELGYIPKGYKLQEETEVKLMHYKKYVNQNGEKCVYQQITKNAIIRADEIVKEYKEMVFNNSRYYIREKNGLKHIVWYTNQYQYWIQADLPVNELVKMVQSIEEQQ